MTLTQHLLDQQARLQHAVKAAPTTSQKIAHLQALAHINEQLRALLKSKQA